VQGQTQNSQQKHTTKHFARFPSQFPLFTMVSVAFNGCSLNITADESQTIRSYELVALVCLQLVFSFRVQQSKCFCAQGALWTRRSCLDTMISRVRYLALLSLSYLERKCPRKAHLVSGAMRDMMHSKTALLLCFNPLRH